MWISWIQRSPDSMIRIYGIFDFLKLWEQLSPDVQWHVCTWWKALPSILDSLVVDHRSLIIVWLELDENSHWLKWHPHLILEVRDSYPTDQFSSKPNGVFIGCCGGVYPHSGYCYKHQWGVDSYRDSMTQYVFICLNTCRIDVNWRTLSGWRIIFHDARHLPFVG